MDPREVANLHSAFGELVRVVPGSDLEVWHARDLQEVLDYTTWRSFHEVIIKARTSCQNAGVPVTDHFADVSKMVPLGSGAERAIQDIMLTRYACYLVAQNADPRKRPVAFAQSYFALQTRKQEMVEASVANSPRAIQ